MSKKILKELTELVQAEVIDSPTADRIKTYYAENSESGQSRLLLVFSFLGAALCGLGIILLLAHNWDNFARPVKTFLAFLPLVIGQVVVGYVLLQQKGQRAWQEGAAVFLFLAIGASISLVSQVYNIPGKISSFMLTWMLLGLPLMYLLRSSFASLFFIAGVTYYACEVNYFTYGENIHHWFWLLFAAGGYHYYQLLRDKPDSNFFNLHSWTYAISLIILLGTFIIRTEEYMVVAYMSLFGLYYIAGNSPLFGERSLAANPFKLLGMLGTGFMFIVGTFEDVWIDFSQKKWLLMEDLAEPEIWVALVLTLVALGSLIRTIGQKSLLKLQPIDYAFLIFAVLFVAGRFFPGTVTIISNILVLAAGIAIIRRGSLHNDLGTLNFGLLLISALIISRFFDRDLSFLMRGIIFIALGAGFFLANYQLLQRRKKALKTEDHG